MAGDLSLSDWNDYPTFVAVARAGSFRGAAKRLGKSSTALSLRIGRFETRLGRKLFRRFGYGLELTPDGERILALVGAAETHLNRVEAPAQDPGDAVEGECRVALGDGMGTYWFPRFVAAFGHLHPRVALIAQTSTERILTKGPGHDIRIQYTDTPDESLVASRVATLHFMPFASRGYLKENSTPLAVEDLAHHRLVDFTLAGSDRGTFATLCGVPDRTMLIANSIGTQCEAIHCGAGIGVLPTYAGLVHANLVPVLPTVRFPMPVFLCYEREAAKRPAVRATLDFLRNVVFDRARMPWFADEFVPPEEGWDALIEQCVARAMRRNPLQLNGRGASIGAAQIGE